MVGLDSFAPIWVKLQTYHLSHIHARVKGKELETSAENSKAL